MMHDLPDIDIDLADRDQLLKLIKHIPAVQKGDDAERVKHNTGVYTIDIPTHCLDGYATYDYKQAENLGYFKLDLLNVGVYTLVRDRAHLHEMLHRVPDWSELWRSKKFANKIIHINGYYNLLTTMKPDSVTRMAAFISIIRPGKAHLQNKPWDEVFKTVWDGDSSYGYVFKQAHAVSYATLVKLHINLLQSGAEEHAAT